MLKCLTESFSQTAIFLVVPQLVLLHQNLLLKWKFATFIMLKFIKLYHILYKYVYPFTFDCLDNVGTKLPPNC